MEEKRPGWYFVANSSGSTPSGTINITTNGEHNVSQYAKANVNVSGTITPRLGFMQINGVNVSDVVEVYDETSMDLLMENGETWSVNLIADVETGDEIMRYFIDGDFTEEHLITSYIVGAPNVGIDYPNALDVGVNLGRLYGDM